MSSVSVDPLADTFEIYTIYDPTERSPAFRSRQMHSNLQQSPAVYSRTFHMCHTIDDFHRMERLLQVPANVVKFVSHTLR